MFGNLGNQLFLIYLGYPFKSLYRAYGVEGALVTSILYSVQGP